MYYAYRRLSWLHEWHIQYLHRRDFKKVAIQAYHDNPELNGSLEDYLACMKKQYVRLDEYLDRYELWKLSDEERDQFISLAQMRCIYRKTINMDVIRVFKHKETFLKHYSDFVYRKWSLARDISFETFKEWLGESDLIIKPTDGSHGREVLKVSSDIAPDDIRNAFQDAQKGNMLVEECLRAHPAIEAFHPSSLNTVRVVTISNGTKFCVFGALLRMGRHGSVIDNTSAGGVYASIDVNTGILETTGIDNNGNVYDVHPDSGIPIKGFQIPYWKEIVDTCHRATSIFPGLIFAGWDICVLPDGKIEFVEGNSTPDFDGGMQVPKKTGVKYRLRDTFVELYGYDPLTLLSVTSKCPNGYCLAREGFLY